MSLVNDTPPFGAPSGAGGGSLDGLVGKQVGPYRLARRIGEGGMGVVYLGLTSHQRPVAVKVLRPHVAGDPDARRRLAREVVTLRMVRHDLVARVLDADVDGPLPYVATEYVRGASLDDHVREHGALDRKALSRLAFGLGDALAAVHAAGVVHRDLKPANVLLRDGHPVVIDFGIAHIADDSRLTMTGLVMGTPGYLSPELIEGGQVDRATDWWGWAATVAYAATGRPPFGRGPMEAVLDRVRRGEADLNGVPPELAGVLAAALSPDPARRPRPGQLREAIMGFARTQGDLPRVDRGEAGAKTEVILAAGAVEVAGKADPDATGPTPATEVLSSSPGPTEALGNPPGPTQVLAGRLRRWFGDEPGQEATGQNGSANRRSEPVTQMLAHGAPATRVMPSASPPPYSAPAVVPPPTPQPGLNVGRRWFGRDRSTPAARANLPSAGRATTAQPGDTPAARALGRAPAAAPAVHNPAHYPAAQYPVAQYPVAQHPVAQHPVDRYRAAQPPATLRGRPGQQPVANQPGGYQPAPVRPMPQRPGRPDVPAREQGPKPRRTGTVFVGLVLLATSFAAAPVVAAATFAAWGVLARTVDRVAWYVTLRRHSYGRRRSDAFVAAAQSPWQLVLATLITALAILMPLVLAACAYFIVWMWSSGMPGAYMVALPMAAAGAVLGLTSWWGIGGGSLRRGSRAVIRGVTPGGLGSVFAVCLLGILIATALAALWNGGWDPDWYPLSMDPLERLVGETPRDLLPSLTGR